MRFVQPIAWLDTVAMVTKAMNRGANPKRLHVQPRQVCGDSYIVELKAVEKGMRRLIRETRWKCRSPEPPAAASQIGLLDADSDPF